ncbi:YdeI/OmpD-associated family protein [uncultured Mucilaginibacter sp.]|uniref:YdeI/OmpD-associated family protein n=1 Tax=uncultured Mucilaginibacter sp. TaxID=797541 RepID=UPI00262436CF|nr:YdeI/OmpD-associated family protein [uncultured Mucilaginibacter sp.]
MDIEPTTAAQLAKKLLIKTAQHWLFIHVPEGFVKGFAALSIEVKTSIANDETFNGVLFFVKNSNGLQVVLPTIIPVLKPETICWVAYPKKSSGVVSDLEMTGNWTELEKYNLRAVSAASIDQTWTALRLRPINQVKKSTVSNAAIRENELNEFIDTKNRIVHLPDDVKQALEQQPAAFAKYQQLAYSHQKEYLVWILTAKQEKTRTGRVQKMLEKLLD